MTDLTADVLGWIGAGALLLAYGLISAGKMKADDGNYQGLNVIGSVGLIVNTSFFGAYPSTALNIVWMGIAGFALAKILKKQED